MVLLKFIIVAASISQIILKDQHIRLSTKCIFGRFLKWVCGEKSNAFYVWREGGINTTSNPARGRGEIRN